MSDFDDLLNLFPSSERSKKKENADKLFKEAGAIVDGETISAEQLDRLNEIITKFIRVGAIALQTGGLERGEGGALMKFMFDKILMLQTGICKFLLSREEEIASLDSLYNKEPKEEK